MDKNHPDKINGHERSPKWAAVEKAHLKLEPRCQACKEGQNPDAGVQVHHIFPFHYCIELGRPDLELDQRNLITLCETEKDKPSDDHHVLLGHLENFKSYNLSVRDHAKGEPAYNGMKLDSIKVDKMWLFMKTHRPKLLPDMTDDEKKELRALMDSTFPLIEAK